MEIVGWILLSLAALILLVLFTPLRVKLEYLEAFSLKVYLFGCIRVFRLDGDAPPKAPKDKPDEKIASEEAVAPTAKSKPSLKDELASLKEREGVSGVLSFFRQLLSIVTGTLRRVASFLTVRRLSLCVRVGGEEADEIAKTYGTVSAVLFPTLAALTKVLRIKKQRVLVKPDFLARDMTARMRMIVWVWPFGIVWAAVAAFFKFIGTWMKVTNVPAGTNDTLQTKTESE